MALGFFLLILLIVACAANEARTPYTSLQESSLGGCGPKASHSAPPSASYVEPVRFVCGDCGSLRSHRTCETCGALASGMVEIL
jgi:hypothetical protein